MENRRFFLVCSERDRGLRLNLYEISGKVYFGELTFTPDGGMLSYFTKSFDASMGELMKLEM